MYHHAQLSNDNLDVIYQCLQTSTLEIFYLNIFECIDSQVILSYRTQYFEIHCGMVMLLINKYIITLYRFFFSFGKANSNYSLYIFQDCSVVPLTLVTLKYSLPLWSMMSLTLVVLRYSFVLPTYMCPQPTSHSSPLPP